MSEHVTCLRSAAGIDRDVSFVNVPNDAFFIDHEGGPIAEALLLVEDTIIFDDGAFEIAENRKRNPNLFCKFAVGGNTVYTHAENLSIGRFEFGDISLIRLQFLRSTTGERQHINRQHDVFLAFEVAQLVSLSVSGTKREVRSRVTDFQVCFGRSWLLGQRGNVKHSKQHNGYQPSSIHDQDSLPSEMVVGLRVEFMHKAPGSQGG